MSDESRRGQELNADTSRYTVDDSADELRDGSDLQDPDVDDADDSLDEGYSPPDRARGSLAWGVTEFEESQDETIEQRIKQEIPDPSTAYGAPDNESGLDDEDELMVGGDDPDAIPAEDDFIGDGGQRTGRLVAPDQGVGEDEEKDEVAQDVGIDAAAASAEEAAMHVATDEPGYYEADFGSDDDADADGLTEATAYRIENEDERNRLDSLDSPNDEEG